MGRVLFTTETQGAQRLTENGLMVNCTPTKLLLFSVPSVPLW